eukprot:TRINITY_DN779_c0_g2_i2.p1 TRINITY_DN779_c0_g2~~TRINITY_DN779_c0_g2_i2.p1  ORF type:complete len:452 (-),score=72.88 TRINITY_DN779_c0_g2_i2:1577-2932(-)
MNIYEESSAREMMNKHVLAKVGQLSNKDLAVVVGTILVVTKNHFVERVEPPVTKQSLDIINELQSIGAQEDGRLEVTPSKQAGDIKPPRPKVGIKQLSQNLRPLSTNIMSYSLNLPSNSSPRKPTMVSPPSPSSPSLFVSASSNTIAVVGLTIFNTRPLLETKGGSFFFFHLFLPCLYPSSLQPFHRSLGHYLSTSLSFCLSLSLSSPLSLSLPLSLPIPITTVEKTQVERLVLELLTTEETYITSLDIIIKDYVNPLKVYEERVQQQYDSTLPYLKVSDTFSSVFDLFSLHKEFYEDLRTRLDDWDDTNSDKACIADVLFNWLPKMKPLYSTYGSKFEKNNMHRTVLLKADPALDAIFEELEVNSTRIRRLALGSLIITPIQRLPRYELFFRDMLKHRLPSHPDHVNIQVCFLFLFHLFTLPSPPLFTRLLSLSLPENFEKPTRCHWCNR